MHRQNISSLFGGHVTAWNTHFGNHFVSFFSLHDILFSGYCAKQVIILFCFVFFSMIFFFMVSGETSGYFKIMFNMKSS